LQKKVREKKIW